MLGDKISTLQRRLSVDGWVLLPLRLMVGFGFAAHGYAKLARGPESFSAVLAAIGVPAPVFMSWATSLLELLGGIALMLGAAVVPLSVPMAVIMVIAMLGVHARYGFSSIKLRAITAAGADFGPPGFELNLLYIAALFTLAFSRPSLLSVDRWLEAKKGRAR